MHRGKDEIVTIKLRVYFDDTPCRCPEFHHNKFVFANYVCPGKGYGTSKAEALRDFLRKAKRAALKPRKKR